MLSCSCHENNATVPTKYLSSRTIANTGIKSNRFYLPFTVPTLSSLPSSPSSSIPLRLSYSPNHSLTFRNLPKLLLVSFSKTHLDANVARWSSTLSRALSCHWPARNSARCFGVPLSAPSDNPFNLAFRLLRFTVTHLTEPNVAANLTIKSRRIRAAPHRLFPPITPDQLRWSTDRAPLRTTSILPLSHRSALAGSGSKKWMMMKMPHSQRIAG